MAIHEDPSEWIVDACVCEQLNGEATLSDARMTQSTDFKP